MTLFDAPRTFISLCINMLNIFLEHVGGAARYCIVCTFFCVSSFLSQFLSGVVWSLRFLGDDEIRRGDQARSIGGMHCNGAL
jgi:hypothetical protein